MGYKKKTSLTQRNIKNSLITLMETNKFDLITVKQIIEEAEITRSTFYRYYDDKYQLLSEIEDNILKEIYEARQKIDTQLPSEDVINIETFKQLFVVLDPHVDIIRLLLGHNGDSSFEMKLKNEIAKRFIDLDKSMHLSKVRRDLVKEYMYVLLIKTFQYWSTHKDNLDIEEVAETLRDIQTKGFRKSLNL